MKSQTSGYSALSIALHWISAICIVALFLTHEGARGSSQYLFHVSFGAIAGVFLLWRAWHRIRRGVPERPKQHYLFQVAAKSVFLGFLCLIVVVVISGYLLPWTLGQPLLIFDILAVPSPISKNPSLHQYIEKVHDVSGHLFVPLLVLHVLAVLKHLLVDRDGVASRMSRPEKNGS